MPKALSLPNCQNEKISPENDDNLATDIIALRY